MRFLAVTTLLTALAVASPVAESIKRADRPPARDVKIKSVSVQGDGCLPGTVTGDIGEDGSMLSLTYGAFKAVTGNGASAADARRFCNVRVNLDYPAGWSYTVATTTLRGYANIPAQCSGRLGALFFFSGDRDDARCTANFRGPTGEIQFTEQAAVDTIVWSKCGVKGKEGPLFNVKSDVSLDCNRNAQLGVDTQDTKFVQKLLLQWRAC